MVKPFDRFRRGPFYETSGNGGVSTVTPSRVDDESQARTHALAWVNLPREPPGAGVRRRRERRVTSPVSNVMCRLIRGFRFPPVDGRASRLGSHRHGNSIRQIRL